MPAANRQAANWTSTGAPGCDGLVPAKVAPRLAWTAPSPVCFDGDPIIDGAGDLVFAWDNLASGKSPRTVHLSFFPADGAAGLDVSNAPNGVLETVAAPRPRGFYTSIRSFSPATGITSRIHAAGANGDDEGLVDCGAGLALAPDPRGGYVESRIRVDHEPGGITWNLELRWVEPDLVPRTEWIWLTSWDYDYDVSPEIHVDVHGKALVLLFFDPPMSMPCQGNMTRAAWAAEDGSISVFTPVTPSYVNSCYGVSFADFGSATTLGEGGFAFFVQPIAQHIHPSGWYAYASGSGIPVAPPSWTRDRDGPVQRLASGAYLTTRRDPATCERTAEILGPSGQLCATLAIDGSEGCDEVDLISADGTLALHALGSCSVRWWPMLGAGP